MSFTALVGAQFGSEGKGAIVAHLARDYNHHVRVGAANAGHTLYTSSAPYPPGPYDAPELVYEKHVMQQIPCAAYANPNASLYIGPGAQISPEIFHRELTTLYGWRREHRLPAPAVYVDHRAHVITEDQIAAETDSDLADRIGSTSTLAREGIGMAQAARVMRNGLRFHNGVNPLPLACVTAGEFYGGEESEDVDCPLYLVDVPSMLHRATHDVYRSRGDVLLEGTQGTGLSLTTGPFPYTTSRNTTAAGLCADAGVGPMMLDRVIMVCRSYPIRVAGPSGPFAPGSDELTWEELGVNPENERTTVTKKIRRVATFSLPQIHEAAILNSATELALTFADYLDPGIAGKHGRWTWRDLSDYPNVAARVRDMRDATSLTVSFIGTGPHSVIELT